MTILENVDNRVSTSKAASQILQGIGSIDKLSFSLQHPISEYELVQNLKYRGVAHKLKRLRDRRWYIQIGPDNSGFFCRKPSLDQDITQFITNPSVFRNYTEYISQVRNIIPDFKDRGARPFRMDLAVDYHTPLKRIIRDLNCKNKRSKVEFLSQSERYTGLNIGSGNEKFVVYDYSERHQQEQAITRIECQLKGSKVPINSVDELPQLPKLVVHKNPFDLLDLRKVNVCSQHEYPLEADHKRIAELSSLIDHNGFLSARKKLNTNRNFKRDYEKYLKFEHKYEQPSHTIIESINQYIEGA